MAPDRRQEGDEPERDSDGSGHEELAPLDGAERLVGVEELREELEDADDGDEAGEAESP